MGKKKQTISETRIEPDISIDKDQVVLKTKFFKSRLFLGVLAIFTASLIAVLAFYVYFFNRIYPGNSIAQVDVSTLTALEAQNKIEDVLKKRTNKKLEFSSAENTQKFTLDLTGSITQSDIENQIAQIMLNGHKRLYKIPTNTNLTFQFSPSLQYQISEIAKDIDQPAIDSQIKIEGDQINVTPSQEGLVVDQEQLIANISTYINSGGLKVTQIPIKKSYPKLSYQTALGIKKRLDQIKLSPVLLTFKNQSYPLDFSTILTFIDLTNSQSSLISGNLLGENFNIASAAVDGQDYFDTRLVFDKKKISGFLSPIAEQINQPMQEPLFSFDPNAGQKKVSEFRPPQEGRTLEVDQASNKIAQLLFQPDQNTIELPVTIVEPKNKLANQYGIKELIGSGVSHFAHSIPNRIYNVNLATSRINGIIIPPGENFSFVKTVGEISAATGYRQGYVIKSGKTVLDDGGGVCQVSTTVFRAALNAGLPIVARTAHAYRVEYYEQGFPPGLDATIFEPSVDFQFKNDTSSSILIQAHTEGTTLYVDFYGTSDGRVVNLTKPVILSTTPALPDIRQDDPTLPKGEVKQVDWATAGANVVFSRTVTRRGETIINDTFRSNYRPWQNVYLVGTKEG